MGRPVCAMIADSGTHTVSMLTRSSQRGARMTYPSSVRPSMRVAARSRSAMRGALFCRSLRASGG